MVVVVVRVGVGATHDIWDGGKIDKVQQQQQRQTGREEYGARA